jgi:tetratricopeptide (TPR) repeat protein
MSELQEYIFDEAALISRLSTALNRRPQQVICIIGSPLTSPLEHGAPGVPGVEGIIQMIRDEFSDAEPDRSAFESAVGAAAGRRYQAAFRYLQGTRGQGVANEIIRRAVLCARTNQTLGLTPQAGDGECRLLEADRENWHLNPGILALGRLISTRPEIFGSAVLTTNFDPLLEIAIRRASGSCYKTVLHAEGSLTQTEAEGCHVIHLHGYWFGSDTLHTKRQLMQDRPRLRTSLASLLRDKVVLVCGYGGWDDVLTSTLLDLVRDDSSSIEVLWTLHGSAEPSSPVLDQFLASGMSRGRVAFYSGIDCNWLFPQLLDVWTPPSQAPIAVADSRSNPVRVTPQLTKEIDDAAEAPRVLEGDDEDRPPVVDFCIGRDGELRDLAESSARVIFITGIGGQGKSTLAASYFARAQAERRFRLFVWRDCKEEGETFENQLASLIETLSGGVLSGSDLAKRPLGSLVEILVARLRGVSGLLVFDNVDHFVNLNTGRLTAAADLFVRRFLEIVGTSQIVFTCRPEIWQSRDGVLSLHLEGLSLTACAELFAARHAPSQSDEIADAHALTDGHAFWLDLLALQVARGQGAALSSLVAEIRSGEGPLPDLTLQSVWSKLADRETLVLHALAETLRPVSDEELGEYLSRDLNYNRINKALKALRRLNLIVVKRSSQDQDLYELHPLVRRFVRGRFTGGQRASMIDMIITFYQKFRGTYRAELTKRPSFTFLQNWTQGAELATQAGKYAEAYEWLAESRVAFAGSAFVREYVRVVRQLLDCSNWVVDWPKYAEFDMTFEAQTRAIANLGLFEELDGALDKFSLTVPEEDSRFILYCDMRCHAAWMRENYQDAIEWGERGAALFRKSNVDTESYIEYTLALARRDAGSPEVALPTFLKGRPLAEVIDPEEFGERLGGPYYGNIGRCLQMMGQLRGALVCYQKSALLIEKDYRHEHVMNQGYARLWIGEVLLSRNQRELGTIFLDAARKKWEEIAPLRAKRLEEILRQIRPVEDPLAPGGDARESEAVCLEWIRGRDLDQLFD